MQTISQFGWTPEHQQSWDQLAVPNAQPARVVADFGTSLKLATPEIITAELSGKLAHYTEKEAMPKVGDWVAVTISDNNAVIESVVLRSNEIARKVTGRRTVKQIIAANIDTAFVLVALDKEFNVERLKRFLYQLSVSSIESIVVLNKADKTDDVQSYLNQIESLGVHTIVTIASEGIGLQLITKAIKPGKTAILLGSSGVGKSTLTNKLLGRDTQATNTTRASDDSGKHTTVHRELFILPNGSILIDTPGIRELQLWGTEDELEDNYDDISSIAARCKYRSCRHTSEAGCAINVALAAGILEQKHYDNYMKMKQELEKLAVRNGEKIKAEKQHASRQNKKRLSEQFDADENY